MDTLADAALLVRMAKKQDEPMLKIFPELDKKLQGTPRFLFDESAIHTAVELTLGRPKVLLEAMRHLHIPYQRIWIEWPESGRAKLREMFDDEGYTGPDRPLPERLGFLLECTDNSGRRGTVHWCWTSPMHRFLNNGSLVSERLAREIMPDFPNVGAISPYFDLEGRLDQPNDKIEGFLRGNLCRLWQDNPVQLEALFDIWRTAQHGPNEWGFEYCNTIVRNQGQRALEAHLANMWADVYGEYIIIWACLLLLTSSRKTVDYRPVDRSKINKQRKQRRQAPLFDHTEVIMYLGDRHVVGQRRQPLSYKRKPPRVHMVGSFLNRRNDKYWVVQPFMRGQGEMINRHIKVRA